MPSLLKRAFERVARWFNPHRFESPSSEKLAARAQRRSFFERFRGRRVVSPEAAVPRLSVWPPRVNDEEMRASLARARENREAFAAATPSDRPLKDFLAGASRRKLTVGSFYAIGGGREPVSGAAVIVSDNYGRRRAFSFSQNLIAPALWEKLRANKVLEASEITGHYAGIRAAAVRRTDLEKAALVTSQSPSVARWDRKRRRVETLRQRLALAEAALR